MNYLAGFGYAAILVGLVALSGIVVFLIFGCPLLDRIGEYVSRLYFPSDSSFRIMPEYSVAEARVRKGRYHEAIDEYRKVIEQHPADAYPHLRIADLAVKHLSDPKLAEQELVAAFAKAQGEDTIAIVAGRLADLYQHNLKDPARALEVMEQLRVQLPGTKAAARAEERIRTLREWIAGREPRRKPGKIAFRATDEETLRKRRGF